MLTETGKPMIQTAEAIPLSEWRASSRPLTITWFDREIKFFYKPNMIDAEHFDALKKDETLTVSEWAVGYCLRIIDAIPDICADGGSPLEINKENLRKLGTRMLNEMINAITADLATSGFVPESSTEPDSNPLEG